MYSKSSHIIRCICTVNTLILYLLGFSLLVTALMYQSFLRIWYFRCLIGFLENLLDRYRSEHHWSVFCHYYHYILLGNRIRIDNK
jgi:hypothetical protein